MSSIFDWSLTPGDNATADSDINWQEGQFPATVNNSARQMMGRVAEWRDDISGQLVPTGVNVKTLTTNSAIAAYANGLMIAFRNNATTTGAVTLNVNGLGARAIRRMTPTGDAALTSGMMIASMPCHVMFSTSANGGAGAWILLNPVTDQLFSPIAGSSSITTVGALNSGSIASGFGNINIGTSDLSAGTAVIGDGTATPIVATRTSTINVSYEARPSSGNSVFWGLGAADTFAVDGDANLNSSPWMAVTATSATFAGSLSATTGTFSGTVSASSYTGDGSGLSGIVPTSRTITAGSGLSGGGNLSANRSLAVDSTVVRTSRTITAGTGLSGGGDLSANRTLSVSYGTTSGTAAQGNDSRIVNAVPSSRTITAGDGLTGGGNLSANRTLSVDGTVVRATRTISAGNGLTGGGNLSANRTLAVDSTVVRTTGNQSISGTKNFTGTLQSNGNLVSEVYTGGGIDTTTFPIGHTVMVVGTAINRNAVMGVHLHSSNNREYVINGSADQGAALAGTYRSRGAGAGDSLMQRVA